MSESILWKDILWTNPNRIEVKILNDYAFNKFDEESKVYQAFSHCFLDFPVELIADSVEYKNKIATLMYWKTYGGTGDYVGYLIMLPTKMVARYIENFQAELEKRNII